MKKNNTAVQIWKGQAIHLTGIILLLVLVYFFWVLINKPFPIAFWCAVACPIIHQVYVWLAWRLELRNAAISNTLGFRGYVILFFMLFTSRFISLFALAWVDRGSLSLDIAPVSVLTILLAAPGIYALYSVKKYFGMERAAGADHFDEQYRSMPFVKKGIFRFTSNGMYLYAFLLFWAIAVACNSNAALIVAAFSHAYIWVHYYATERPDMNFLYNPPNQSMQ